LLVSPLSGFAEYQRQRAWTWEHQALVRARCVVGDAALCASFESVRDAVLARPRDAATLAGEVVAMRQRMRDELDRSTEVGFDIKQGEGGLVDLEFLLQFLVLRDAAREPALLAPRDTPGLLLALCAAGAIAAPACEALRQAHEVLLDAGLRCTLDRRPRLLPETPAIAAARATIRSAWLDGGL
jgi:glutamate-ammonia-ligase adenylyltransferase